MNFIIINKPPLLTRPFLLKALRFAFSALENRGVKPRAQELTIAFLSKKEIQALNSQFRKKNQATDILSFSPVEKGSLGELALFFDPERARERGLPSEDEIFYLLLHGILHLLGYTHEAGGSEARRMFKLQDGIFNAWEAQKK